MSSISKGNRATGIVRRAWDAALDFIQRKEVVGMDKNGNKYYRSAISVLWFGVRSECDGFLLDDGPMRSCSDCMHPYLEIC
jgi:hypothetical protein